MPNPDDNAGALPRRWATWLALGAWVVVLALWLGRGQVPELSLTTLGHGGAFTAWLHSLAWRAGAQFLAFLLLGLLSVFCLPSRATRVGRFLLRWLPSVGLSLAIALVLLQLQRRGAPLSSLRGLGGLALAWTGCLVGTWAGMALARGLVAALLFIPQLLLLTAALLGGSLYWVGRAVAPTAAAISMPKVGSAERRHLYDLLASKNPVAAKAPATITLALSPHDLNVLVAWLLSVKGSAAQLTTDLVGERIRLWASLPIEGRTGFFNVAAEGTLSYREATLAFALDRLRVGRLQIPAPWLKAAAPLAREVVAKDERLRPLFARLQELEVRNSTLAVTYTPGALPPGLVSRLFHDRRSTADDVPATRAQIANLIAAAQSLPRNTEARFGAAVRTAFQLAERRSSAGHAIDENRAAVLALGIAIGHPDVETLMGDFLDDKSRRALRVTFAGTTLRRREDWPKHFFVSAALTVITAGGISDAGGVLKEEKDAAGGSGFSFADLLADRAGTTFATVATRSDNSARALQERLSSGFHVDDYFPRADGLPEGIEDAEFQRRYGGVGGEEYRRLDNEISRRLAECPAYRVRD